MANKRFAIIAFAAIMPDFAKSKDFCNSQKQYGSVAQLVEQVPEEHRVGGSIPPRATILMKKAGSLDPAFFIPKRLAVFAALLK